LVHGAQTVSRVGVQVAQTYVSAEHTAQDLHTASWVAVHGETCTMPAPVQLVHDLQTVFEKVVQAACL
jgi:reverse gyrase